MRLQDAAAPRECVHLTYCLNVHPGETWKDNLRALQTDVLDVRNRVAPDRPFGLGLRLSRIACDELDDPARLAEFRRFLQEHKLYVFTINGFPYGEFHDTRVKQNVYAPDWRSDQRLTYTIRLANILAALLPDGVPGSISTVPGSYREWIRGNADRDRLVDNLIACARHLGRIETSTGRRVTLALEPEPDCLFDTTADTVDFFSNAVARRADAVGSDVDWRRYLGVCLDACHLSVQFENPADSLAELRRHGVAVPKVHLSAALRAETGGAATSALEPFAEGTYLHQARMRTADGTVTRWSDLAPEVFDAVEHEEGGEVRVHVHVPLYFRTSGVLQSTVSDLDARFFRAVRDARVPHLEIETYTFNVLPPVLADRPIAESITEEYRWTLGGLAQAGLRPATTELMPGSS